MIHKFLFLFLFVLVGNSYSFQYIQEVPVKIIYKSGFPINNREKIEEYKVWAVVADITKYGGTDVYKIKNLRVEKIFLCRNWSPLSSIKFEIKKNIFKLSDFKYIRTIGWHTNFGAFHQGEIFTPSLRIHLKDGRVMKVSKNTDSPYKNTSYYNNYYGYIYFSKESFAGKTTIVRKNSNFQDENKILIGFSATKKDATELYLYIRDLRYHAVSMLKENESKTLDTYSGKENIRYYIKRNIEKYKQKGRRKIFSRKYNYIERERVNSTYFLEINGRSTEINTRFTKLEGHGNFNYSKILKNDSVDFSYTTNQSAIEKGFFEY